MRYLCLDVGERRIGLAISDLDGRLATPVGAIQRKGLRQDISRILKCTEEKQTGGIVVGIPFSLDGKAGSQAKKVEAFVKAIRRATELPLYMMDERFSTAEAERLLRQAGREPSRNRGEVDAAAATVILQEYLDCLNHTANT